MEVPEEMPGMIGEYVHLHGSDDPGIHGWGFYDDLVDAIWKEFNPIIRGKYSGSVYDFCCAFLFGTPEQKFELEELTRA
jgi:hypothetical protein